MKEIFYKAQSFKNEKYIMLKFYTCTINSLSFIYIQFEWN